MIGYRIIEENKEWYFEFIPTNNKKQPIGRSKSYLSKIECKEAVKELRSLVVSENIDSEKSSFIKMERVAEGWYFEYRSENIAFYRSRIYIGKAGKANCKKSIKSIYKKIDEYTSTQLWEN